MAMQVWSSKKNWARHRWGKASSIQVVMEPEQQVGGGQKAKRSQRTILYPTFQPPSCYSSLEPLNLHQSRPTACQGPAFPDLFQLHTSSFSSPSLILGSHFILLPIIQNDNTKLGSGYSVVFTNWMMHWIVFPVVRKHTSSHARLNGYLKITFYS